MATAAPSLFNMRPSCFPTAPILVTIVLWCSSGAGLRGRHVLRDTVARIIPGKCLLHRCTGAGVASRQHLLSRARVAGIAFSGQLLRRARAAGVAFTGQLLWRVVGAAVGVAAAAAIVSAVAEVAGAVCEERLISGHLRCHLRGTLLGPLSHPVKEQMTAQSVIPATPLMLLDIPFMIGIFHTGVNHAISVSCQRICRCIRSRAN